MRHQAFCWDRFVARIYSLLKKHFVKGTGFSPYP